MPWLEILMPVLLAGGGGILFLTFRRTPNPRAGLNVVLGVLALFLLFFNPLAGFIQRPSTETIAAWLNPRLLPTDRVYTLWDYGPFSDFPAYLDSTIGVAGEVPEEQLFGAMLDTAQAANRYPGLVAYLALPKTPKPTPTAVRDTLLTPFLKILRGPQRVYVLVAASQFELFCKLYPDVPVHMMLRTTDFVLFSNQPLPAQPAALPMAQ
jgi:hypothetical protein